MSREPTFSGFVDLDDVGDIVFAPRGRINRSRPQRPFATLNITSGFYLSAGDPTALDRLAKAAADLAHDLRTALAEAAESAAAEDGAP